MINRYGSFRQIVGKIGDLQYDVNGINSSLESLNNKSKSLFMLQKYVTNEFCLFGAIAKQLCNRLFYMGLSLVLASFKK